MVGLTQQSIFERSLTAILFWTGLVGCIIGLSLPSVTGVLLFLVFLSATVLGSIFLALSAPKRSVLIASTLVFATSHAVLSGLTDELGWLTGPVSVLAFWFSLIVLPVLVIGLLRLVLESRPLFLVAATSHWPFSGSPLG